jgi:hypothetical protein
MLPMHYHVRRRNKFNLLGNLWKATLPLLTISTVQYDTHMISQLMTECLQDSEFAKQFQSLKARTHYVTGAYIVMVVSASRTVPYAASCYMITTTR